MNYPFSHARQAISSVAAAHRGPKERKVFYGDRVQCRPESVGLWVDVARVMYAPRTDEAGNVIRAALVVRESAQDDRILWWSSHSDDTEADAVREGPGALTKKDREVIRDIAAELRLWNLTPDHRPLAIICRRVLWWEIPNGKAHLATACDF